MGKTILINGKENCHLVSFRFVLGTHQLVALFFFEEEIMMDNLCLVITSAGEEYVENKQQILDSTEIAYTEQLDICKKRSIPTHPKRGYPFTFRLSRSSEVKPDGKYQKNRFQIKKR